MWLGNRVILSYRGNYYNYARQLAHAMENSVCRTVVLFPPNILCAPNEILMPYEYVEIMGRMRDEIHSCDAFVYVPTDDYYFSYFTQTEILQWQLYRDTPFVYPVALDLQGNCTVGPVQYLEKLSSNTKRLWANVVTSIDRSQSNHLSYGFSGGKFNRNCYLTSCAACGEHFLISKKLMNFVLSSLPSIYCPHCGFAEIFLGELDFTGNFYRNPIINFSIQTTASRVLESNEILSLLIDNELPPKISILQMKNETLDSDITKVVKGYAIAGAVIVAGFFVASLFNKDDA